MGELKMGDSPIKRLSYDVVGKENIKNDDLVVEHVDAIKKPIVEESNLTTEDKQSIRSSIKAQEADEPLLQENPHRFVLFPIKYHEVSSNPSSSLDASNA